MDHQCTLPSQRHMGNQWRRLSGWLLTLALSGALLGLPTPLAAQTPTPAASASEELYYSVRRGESWSLIADRFGLTVRALQNANPDLIRYNDVLKVGDQVLIPGSAAATQAPTTITEPTATVAEPAPAAEPATPEYYLVRRGEGWSHVAARFGVSLRDLFDANPDLIRYDYILHTGDRVLIPGAVAPAVVAIQESTPVTATPTATASATSATANAGAQATPTAAATPSATSSAITATGQLTASAPVTANAETSAPTASELGACPATIADFPAQLKRLLETVASEPDGGAASLTAYLAGCQAAVADSIQASDWTGDGVTDLLVLYTDPAATSDAPFKRGDLILFVGGPDGYRESYRARAAGEVTLFALADINRDGQSDVSWVDRTCGASTCFDTVEVVSWDGEQWRDWTEEVITMAFAEISLADTTPVGQGDEIVLLGGDYGSVGAGPQRQRTETWVSLDGGAYTLLERTYAASTCLYHTVLDANEAFLKGTAAGFAQAEERYTEATSDQTLEKCWSRADELDELRSFSRFRLALTAAYGGNRTAAADHIASLSTNYPDSVYAALGEVWLTAYTADLDLGAACSAANEFAAENAAAYDILADYGYANPTFTVADVCPILDVDDLLSGAASPLTGTVAVSATGTISPALAAGALPVCPGELNGYQDALLDVLRSAEGDSLIIETWLRQCAAMSDERGGYRLVDANGDGVEDAIFWPTVVSELGFGPDGAQGDLLIFHGLADGGYELTLDEEIYGQPILLAAEDLNGDQAVDLAWQVVGCSTFCVLEAQLVSWTGDDYSSIIQPGATIAEASARFEPVAAGDPGGGQQLILEGGVSGTADGGLAIPHTEVWQSVNGAAFQRIRWLYDHSVEGSDCMGLRLVEADAALQAAPVLGYEPASELYRAAIDPSLQACSIFGLSGEEEIKLLQGLASFRLVQAQALGGDFEGANTTLAALTKGQPTGGYTAAATTWLATYGGSEDAAAACEAVSAIFAEDALLWQITDHYGYNHPALAAEQICYAP